MNFAAPAASHAALLVAAIGLILGLIAAAWTTRAQGAGASFAMRRRDAQADLTLAIDNLRELAEREGALRPGEGERERTALEARAAAALQALQMLDTTHGGAAPEQTGATPTSARARPARSATVGYLAARPRLQGALWGAGTASVALFLTSTVQKGATPVAPPVQKAPFAAAGGGAPPGGQGIDAGELDALKAALAKNPDDVAALVRLAHLALQAQEIGQADALTERALRLQPDQVEAQVHAAVVRAGKGEAAEGMAALEKVLAAHAEFAEGWFFRGMLSMQAGNMDAMRESFGQFVKVAPDGPQKERIRAMLQRTNN